MRLPGLGPKTARRIWQELGITTIADLQAAAEAQQLRGHAGIGPGTEEKIAAALAQPRDVRRPAAIAARDDAAEAASRRRRAARAPCVRRGLARGLGPAHARDRSRPRHHRHRLRPAGARRLLLHPAVGRRGRGARGRRRQRSSPTTVCASTCASSRRRATATCCSTSPARRTTTSRCARTRSAAGCSVSEYSVTEVETGEEHHFAREEDVYRFLGYDWIPPELREDGGELAAARADALPALVELADLRGDLHTHTTWSDGKDSLEEMVAAAQAPRVRVLRDLRSLAAASRRPARPAVGGDRRAERAGRAVPHPQGDRGEHSPRRLARRAGRASSRRRDWVVASVHSRFDHERDRARLCRDGEPVRRLHRSRHESQDRQAGALAGRRASA